MKWFSFFLALCLVLPLLLVPAWAQELDQSSMDLDYYTRYKGQGRSLNVYNWGEYISDGSDDSLDVNKAFEELTGIKVVYSTFDTNESLYAKLKTGGSSYDIIIPSDYMIARMIQEEMLLPLPEIVSQICTAVIVLTTVYSGVEYFMKNLDILRETA